MSTHPKLTTIHREFGVECKNTECKKAIVLGGYLTPRHSKESPDGLDDPIPLIRFTARRVTCPECQKTYEYDHSDLREFPAKSSV
jgi:hypothetical protein